MGDAFHQGIAGGQQQSGNGQQHRQQIGHQHEAEGGETQHQEERQRLRHRHVAGHEGSAPRATDAAIEVAVREVVDDAAGGAHQQGTEHENHQKIEIGDTLRRDPQGPERGPQEQKAANWPIPADEPEERRQLAVTVGCWVHGGRHRRVLA